MTVVSIDTRRRDKLGGSEAAAACGVDPWRSPLMLWFEKLNGIDRSALTPSERVSAEMLARELSDAVAAYGFGAYRIPINSDSGFHTDFAELESMCRNAGFASSVRHPLPGGFQSLIVSQK